MKKISSGRGGSTGRREIVLNPAHPDNAAMVAGHFVSRGEFAKARGVLRDAVEKRPQDAELRSSLAALLLENNEPDAARLHYEAILKRKPGHLPSLVGLAEVHLAKGQWEKALGAYERALNRGRRTPLALGWLDLLRNTHHSSSIVQGREGLRLRISPKRGSAERVAEREKRADEENSIRRAFLGISAAQDALAEVRNAPDLHADDRAKAARLKTAARSALFETKNFLAKIAYALKP